MSLNKEKGLRDIAKIVSRDLRKRSTNAEKLLWNILRDRKYLNLKFYRQYPLFYDVSGKESFFIADFYCFEKKLVVELDGAIHKYQLRKDVERTEILNLLGLKVIRFTNVEIEKDVNKVLEKLKIILGNELTPACYSRLSPLVGRERN